MMTTEAEINAQVDNMYKNFWMSPFDDKIPEGLMPKFREALMHHNAMNLQGAPEVIRQLLDTNEEDLKMVHVGIIVNIIFPTPFNAIYDSPEQAMDETISYKAFEKKWNKKIEGKTKEIEAARHRLLNLSGITNKTINMNGQPLKN